MKAEETETSKLSAYCIAKITSEGYIINPNIAAQYFNKSIEYISPRNKKPVILMGLHLLKEYTTLSPTFFILHCGEIHEKLWDLLLSSNDDIQSLSTLTFSKYLSTLIKTQAYGLQRRFTQLMSTCLTHMKESKSNSSPGVAVIMAHLLRLKPRYFTNDVQDIFNTVTSNMNSKSLPLKQQCIFIRTLLSAVDTPTFHVDFFPSIFTNLINSMNQTDLVQIVCESFVCLCDNVPDPVFERISIILQSCIRVVQNREPANIKAVLNLLKKLISVDASINVTQAQSIWQIVCGVLFTPNFLDLFPLLQKCGSTFWEDHATTICEKVLSALEVLSDYSLHALNLIPMLPSIPEEAVLLMIPNVNKYLFAKNDDLRAAAPKALLHIMSSNDPIEFSKILKQLIAIAASDTSLPVRISIISSFGPDHYPFLAHDPFLKFLKNLANDNSSEVRSHCFRVLKNTRKYSPIGSDSILRNALINALYALQCSASSFERANATESLPALIEASSVLFPIYATTMIPIIIKQLENRGSANSIIGSRAETQLTVNLIKTIESILEVNQPTISPYLTQILPIFTTILKENSNKEIKKLVIDALSLFMKKTESTANIYGIAPQLLDALLYIVSQSESKSLKVKALEFLGQAGAVSPQRIPQDPQTCSSRVDDIIKLCPEGLSQKEYYGSLVFPKLMKMVNDKYLLNLRTQSLSTAITTLSMMTTQSSEHLTLIIPIILNHIQNSVDMTRIESIKQLKSLTIVAKQQMYPHVENILNSIYSQWDSASDLSYFIDVISSLVEGLGCDFLPFLYPLVSKVRRSISSAVVNNAQLANSCLRLSATLASFFPYLTNLFIPQVCKILSSVFVPNSIKITALKALLFHITVVNPLPFAGAIFTAINNLCINPDPHLADQALKVMTTLILLIDKNIQYYAHRIIDILQDDEHATLEFEHTLEQMKESDHPFVAEKKEVSFFFNDNVPEVATTDYSLTHFDVKQFVRCFNDDRMLTPKHWENWYQNLVKISIATSPCTTISCCYQLASIHKGLGHYLFPAAFKSCWGELSSIEQVALSKKLSQSMQNFQIPESILHSIVTLVEQLERGGTKLQIPPEEFIDLCVRSRSLALAIRHAEEDYLATANEQMLRRYAILLAEMPKTIDSHPLLSLMQQPITKEFIIRLKHWEDAYPLYMQSMNRVRENDEHASKEEFIGYINCARKLYKYREIIDRTSDVLSLYKNTISSLSQIFSEAAFFTDITLMPFFSSFECEPTLENLSMKVLSRIISKKYDEAKDCISCMYERIASYYSLNFQSTYPVVYPLVVWCQYLYELSEIVATNGNVPKDIWKQRLSNAEANADVWFTLLLPRMVINPDDKSQFNKFLEIARQDRKTTMFEAFFALFYPKFDPSATCYNIADYAPATIYLRYLWSSNKRDIALTKLENILFDENGKIRENAHFSQVTLYFDCIINENMENMVQLEKLRQILKNVYSKKNQTVFQKWSFTNYYLYRMDRSKNEYALEAMKGFSFCIQTHPVINLSDISAFFSLFYSTLGDDTVSQFSVPLFRSISVQNLNEVIPQLFSFLYSDDERACNETNAILSSMIAESPHQLLLFLMSYQSNGAQQFGGAQNKHLLSLINSSAMNNPTLYNETVAFRNIIVAGSQTIFEQWLSPSREMISSLLSQSSVPIDTSKATRSQLDQLFYKLNESHIQSICQMLSSGQTQNVNKAVQQIVSNSQGFVKRLEVLKLKDVSNNIPSFENSQLIIPGATSSTTLASISRQFDVVQVRSRPRRVTLTGKDGLPYTFLVRNQENSAVNVRVNQIQTLFKMILKRNLSNLLSIQMSVYGMTPITQNVCLIQCSRAQQFFEWLINTHRKSNGIEYLVENKEMAGITIPRIDSLMALQRVEAFRRIEKRSDDLRNCIWQNSLSSDEWFEKSATFSESLALTSCFGALLGLGGRYPSNILINQKTGEISHIDFSMLFGAGKKTVQHPDNLPFRLTPMMIKSLGIDGLNMKFVPTFKKVQNILGDCAYLVYTPFALYAEEPKIPFQSEKTVQEKMAICNSVTDTLLCKKETVDEYIERLIELATDEYSLAKVHSTWRPLW